MRTSFALAATLALFGTAASAISAAVAAAVAAALFAPRPLPSIAIITSPVLFWMLQD